MSPGSHKVTYGSQTIAFHVVRRDRRTLAISVLPDMSVEVVAPAAATEAAIQQRVTKRAAWILRQIQFFRQFHPKTPERGYEPGETHLYLGRRYRLRVRADESATITIKGAFIEVTTPHPNDRDAIRRLAVEGLLEIHRRHQEPKVVRCTTTSFPLPASA